MTLKWERLHQCVVNPMDVDDIVHEIEQNIGVGIEGAREENRAVEGDPKKHHREKGDDERPASAEGGDPVAGRAEGARVETGIGDHDVGDADLRGPLEVPIGGGIHDHREAHRVTPGGRSIRRGGGRSTAHCPAGRGARSADRD